MLAAPKKRRLIKNGGASAGAQPSPSASGLRLGATAADLSAHNAPMHEVHIDSAAASAIPAGPTAPPGLATPYLGASMHSHQSSLEQWTRSTVLSLQIRVGRRRREGPPMRL